MWGALEGAGSESQEKEARVACARRAGGRSAQGGLGAWREGTGAGLSSAGF